VFENRRGKLNVVADHLGERSASIPWCLPIFFTNLQSRMVPNTMPLAIGVTGSGVSTAEHEEVPQAGRLAGLVPVADELMAAVGWAAGRCRRQHTSVTASTLAHDAREMNLLPADGVWSDAAQDGNHLSEYDCFIT
jgi:hypothetical protein